MNIRMGQPLTRDRQLISLLYFAKCSMAVYRGPLNKRTLLKLEEGAYITSNIMFGNGQPVIHSRVGGWQSREKLWKRIAKEKLGGRIFSVFNNKAAYEAEIRSNMSDA